MITGEASGGHPPARGAGASGRPPPGLTVVVASDPPRAAVRLARAVGGERPYTLAEALVELDRRRDLRLEGPRRRLAACGEAAAEVRARALSARNRLPPAVAGLPAAELKRAAQAVDEAALAVAAIREALGPRPHLDEDAARTAREANAAVEQARVERAAALPHANSILGMANAGAAVVVAGRLVSEAFDPAFVLVAVLPLAGLAFAGHAIVRSMRRSRAAAHRRWTALRSLDVCTMEGLDARERRARAWDARSRRLKAAEAELRRARAAWRALVGPTVTVAEAARVASDLDHAGRIAAAAEAAGRSWAEAASLLQQAEDGGGADEPPLVVVDDEPPAGRAALDELTFRAGRVPVVIVGKEADRGTPEHAPAGSRGGHDLSGPDEGATVVDLRDRVRAGLQRLRGRQGARGNPSAPGSVASG